MNKGEAYALMRSVNENPRHFQVGDRVRTREMGGGWEVNTVEARGPLQEWGDIRAGGRFFFNDGARPSYADRVEIEHV